jgi:hypothetical protein
LLERAKKELRFSMANGMKIKKMDIDRHCPTAFKKILTHFISLRAQVLATRIFGRFHGERWGENKGKKSLERRPVFGIK